jgi:mono/diheme cytochrome c family protein
MRIKKTLAEMGRHLSLPLFAYILSLLTSCQFVEEEWIGYQRTFHEREIQHFKKLLETQPENDSLKSLLAEIQEETIGIREVKSEVLGHVDRCTTCHLGMDSEHNRRDPFPFLSHPPYYQKDHPIQKFGCTICHEGKGEALTSDEAHSGMEDIKYLEASCAKCHPGSGEIRGAPLLSSGRKLYQEKGCTGCHKTGGLPDRKIGPSLVEASSKVKKGWFFHWLKDPRGYLPQSKMPNLKVSEEDAFLLTEFLLGRNAGEEDDGDVDWEAYDKGKVLIRESRCISCHAFNGRGGSLGPDLGKIGNKIQKDWILGWIEDPRSHHHNTRMPQFRFTENERNAITTYLLTEYIDSELPSEIPKTLELPESIEEKGIELIRRLGCQGCHVMEEKFVDVGRAGPELTFIASKVSEKAVKEWSIDTSSHPDYGFTDGDVQSLVTFLLTLTGTVIEPSETPYFPSGEAGRLFRKLNCLACHKVRGNGSNLAPDLTFEGSRVNRMWLKDFLKTPYFIRPILIERMPRFRLTNEEIEILTEYIMTDLVNEEIPSVYLKEVQISPKEITEGERLFKTKYGCIACHQMGFEGGSYAPELTEARKRLKPGWIFKWLQNPQHLDPLARMPNYEMSERDAEILTKYLVSEKTREE